MTDKPAVSPYGAARDLPSVQEMEQRIAVLHARPVEDMVAWDSKGPADGQAPPL